MFTDKYAAREEVATAAQEDAKDAKIANLAPTMISPKHKTMCFIAFIKSVEIYVIMTSQRTYFIKECYANY